jgi:membrane protease YdiL (CAAX protease family)
VRAALLAASPLGLIVVCNGVARAAGPTFGAWSWAPTMLVFWAAIAALATASGTPPVARLGPPRGSWLWSLLAIGMGLLSASGFLDGLHTLGSPLVLVAWLVFGLANPWFEETYWRGVLGDATRSWPLGLGIAYSAVAFALSHPYIWGVHAAALRNPKALVGLIAVGLVWSVVYARTGSLRFTILGHACSNLLGLSVPMLLNLHVPPALR